MDLPVERGRKKPRVGKRYAATVRLTVEPGDYVNVAHGGATDATPAALSTFSRFVVPPSPSSPWYAYTLIPITSPAATLRGILFRSLNEIPYKFL